MLSLDTAERRTIKHIPLPVDVSKRDIMLFRSLNPDEAEIRERAERIRMLRAELREFTSDEVVVIDTKLEHLNSIEETIGTGVTIVGILGLMDAFKEGPLTMLTKAVSDNKSHIARRLIVVFEPDYSPAQVPENPEDKKVIVSDAQGASISSILKGFGLSDGIASNIETIYEKGASGPVVTSLVTSAASKYFFVSKPQNDVDASDCAFEERRT